MSTVTTASAQREHRVTARSLAARKREGERITMLTAYDFTFARIFESAGIDVILVGDSVGNVVQGAETTLPVTLDEMIYHTRLVARGVAGRKKYCVFLSTRPYRLVRGRKEKRNHRGAL